MVNRRGPEQIPYKSRDPSEISMKMGKENMAEWEKKKTKMKRTKTKTKKWTAAPSRHEAAERRGLLFTIRFLNWENAIPRFLQTPPINKDITGEQNRTVEGQQSCSTELRTAVLRLLHHSCDRLTPSCNCSPETPIAPLMKWGTESD
jgi:hypothetical protein